MKSINRLTLSWPASMLIFISAIRSKVALRKQQKSLHYHNNDNTALTHEENYHFNLPNAVIVISKLLIVEAKLIHKVSCHLLDLVV